MTQRTDYARQSPELFQKYMAFNTQVKQGAIEASLQDLVTVRASQMNGCTFCLDLHIKQARIHGERELRLHHVAAWRDSTLFDVRERAALAWTELLTRLPAEGVDDAAYAQARAQFSEKELCDLSYVVVAINGWNRINVAFRTAPGIFDQAMGLDKANLA